MKICLETSMDFPCKIWFQTNERNSRAWVLHGAFNVPNNSIYFEAILVVTLRVWCCLRNVNFTVMHLFVTFHYIFSMFPFYKQQSTIAIHTLWTNCWLHSFCTFRASRFKHLKSHSAIVASIFKTTIIRYRL